MNNEPLKPDPRWTHSAAGYHSAKHHVSNIGHSPAAYALGFEDGAYALAADLWTMLTSGKEDRLDEMVKLLANYNNRNARPVKGWEFEPKRG